MLDLFYSTANAIMGWLLWVLPSSPISDWIEEYFVGVANQNNAIITGLSWLNWVVDISACIMVFELWLAAMLVYYAVRLGVGVFGGLKGMMADIVGGILG